MYPVGEINVWRDYLPVWLKWSDEAAGLAVQFQYDPEEIVETFTPKWKADATATPELTIGHEWQGYKGKSVQLTAKFNDAYAQESNLPWVSAAENLRRLERLAIPHWDEIWRTLQIGTVPGSIVIIDAEGARVTRDIYEGAIETTVPGKNNTYVSRVPDKSEIDSPSGAHAVWQQRVDRRQLPTVTETWGAGARESFHTNTVKAREVITAGWHPPRPVVLVLAHAYEWVAVIGNMIIDIIRLSSETGAVIEFNATITLKAWTDGAPGPLTVLGDIQDIELETAFDSPKWAASLGSGKVIWESEMVELKPASPLRAGGR